MLSGKPGLVHFARLMPDLEPLHDSGDLRALINQISKDVAEAEAKGEAPDHYVGGMDLEPNEHYDFLVVLARTTHEWNVLCTKLELEPSKRRHRVGIGRGVPATKLIEMLEAKDGK